jgi:hypothetical protein
MSDAQKKSLFIAIVTFLLALASIFGYDYSVVQPREATISGLESVRTAGVPAFKNLEVLSSFRSRGTTVLDGAVTTSGGFVGSITTAAQPNITSLGTLTLLNVTGGITSTKLSAGNGSVSGGAAVFGTSVSSGGPITGTSLSMGSGAINGGAISGTSLNSSGGVTATSYAIGTNAFTGVMKYGVAATYTNQGAITHGFTVTPTVCFMFPQTAVTETITIIASTFSSNRETQVTPVYWMCGK